MSSSNDLIYKEVKRRLGEQSTSIKSIDTKAALVLSFVGAILAGLVNSSWFNNLSLSYHLFILAPLGLACITGLATLLVRSYRSDPDPKNLIEGYKNKTEAETKAQLIRNYEDVFSKNEPKVNQKAMLSKISFVFLATSILILLFTVVFVNNNSKGESSWQTTIQPHLQMRQHPHNHQ